MEKLWNNVEATHRSFTGISALINSIPANSRNFSPSSRRRCWVSSSAAYKILVGHFPITEVDTQIEGISPWAAQSSPCRRETLETSELRRCEKLQCGAELLNPPQLGAGYYVGTGGCLLPHHKRLFLKVFKGFGNRSAGRGSMWVVDSSTFGNFTY